MKWLWLLLLTVAVSAQQITITGTVKDGNNTPYANGSGRVTLVPSAQWLYQGNPVPNTIPISQLSSTGTFSVNVYNTSTLQPNGFVSGPPQWQFSFCNSGASVCFTMTPLTLTTGQDITASIQAQATVLPTTGGSGFPITATSSSNYTIYPAASSACGAYVVTGTIYCALNNTTNTVQFNSTDLRVLWDDIVGVNLNGGNVYFKNGTYNCNTLDQETTGGFSNYYCIGIPGNVATAQYTNWNLIGEGSPVIVGGSPVQTTGTFIVMTSTARGTPPAHSKIMTLWSRPPTGSGAIGPQIAISNIDFRTVDNQRGCENQVDMSQSSGTILLNVTADTAVTPASLAFPVEDASCTAASWGGPTNDVGGLIQLITANAGTNVQYWNNVNGWGGDTSIDVRGEHSVFFNVYGDSCNHAIDYGVRGPSLIHNGSLINSGWQECARGLTLGQTVQQNSRLDVYGLDIEDATATFLPTFVPVYHADEQHPGYMSGSLSYTAILAGGTSARVQLPGLFDGPDGGGQNMSEIPSAFASTLYITPLNYAVYDNFTRGNSTQLGGGWNVTSSGLSIASNHAAVTATGLSSGIGLYQGANFSTDQFSALTVSTMDSAATTYAQVDVDLTGVGSGRVGYEYWCSKSAGAGQYELGKHSGGVETAFSTSSTATCPTVPFTLEIRNQGGMICAYLNGLPDTNLVPNCAADTTITTGVPGFYMAEDATSGILASGYKGGNLPALDGNGSMYGQPGAWAKAQQFTLIGTTTNCAVNSASPAACGAAAAGAVVIPTTTTTYTVNTSAVTSASRITLQPMTWASNLPSAPTCVAPASGFLGVSAVTAGTSFTVTLPSTTGTVCLMYKIEN